jgi:hypothetical protein
VQVAVVLVTALLLAVANIKALAVLLNRATAAPTTTTTATATSKKEAGGGGSAKGPPVPSSATSTPRKGAGDGRGPSVGIADEDHAARRRAADAQAGPAEAKSEAGEAAPVAVGWFLPPAFGYIHQALSALSVGGYVLSHAYACDMHTLMH